MSEAGPESEHADLLGRLGHELRTPLNAILGFSMLLARADNLTERQRESLATIEQSGRTLLARINRVLEMAEIRPGRLESGDAPEPAIEPDAAGAEAPEATTSRRIRAGRLQPGSDAPAVLVIDDTPANVDLLTELLEGQGLQVLVGQNGTVGISLAQRFRPDLILLDVQMKGLGGFETCGAPSARTTSGPLRPTTRPTCPCPSPV